MDSNLIVLFIVRHLNDVCTGFNGVILLCLRVNEIYCWLHLQNEQVVNQAAEFDIKSNPPDRSALCNLLDNAKGPICLEDSSNSILLQCLTITGAPIKLGLKP